MFVGNPWVGGGDGKIIPPVGLRDLPSKTEGGVVLLFKNVKFLRGHHVTSQGEGDKVVHRVHLAHTLPGLTLPLPPHNSQKTFPVFSLRRSLRAKIHGTAPFNPTHSLVLHPLRQYT